MLDRIDLHVEVPSVKFADLGRAAPGERSALIGERVIHARRRQQARFQGRRITCNARIGSRELKLYFALEEDTLQMLKTAMTDMKLSARAYDCILKVARTIADLAGSETVTHEHVFEAIQMRSLDRQMWG